MGDIGETIRKFKSLNFKKIIISILNTSEIKAYQRVSLQYYKWKIKLQRDVYKKELRILDDL